MDSIQINIGDKFLYTGKYGGGVVKGEIADIEMYTVFDHQHGAMMMKYHIKSTAGVYYKLSEIELCADFYTDEESKAIERKYNAWQEKARKWNLTAELNEGVTDLNIPETTD